MLPDLSVRGKKVKVEEMVSSENKVKDNMEEREKELL